MKFVAELAVSPLHTRLLLSPKVKFRIYIQASLNQATQLQ